MSSLEIIIIYFILSWGVLSTGDLNVSNAIKVNVIEWVQNSNDDNEIDYSYISRCTVYLLYKYWKHFEWIKGVIKFVFDSKRSTKNSSEAIFQCSMCMSRFFVVSFHRICFNINAVLENLPQQFRWWIATAYDLFSFLKYNEQIQIHYMQIVNKPADDWRRKTTKYIRGHHVVKCITQFMKIFCWTDDAFYIVETISI